MAAQWGVANFRFLEMPHPIANLTEAELDERVASLVEDVIQLFMEERL